MKYILNNQKTKDELLQRIHSIDVSKKPIQVFTIENFKNPSTTRQKRYYFGVVVKAMASHYGDSEPEMHQYLKRKFLIPKRITINDFEFDVLPSVKDLSTVDFHTYIELCCRHAAQEMGLYISPPLARV